MIKDHVFRSSNFYMDIDDECHLILIDETGITPSIALYAGRGEDAEDDDPYEDVVIEPLRDLDGNSYTTVVVGTQTWIVENFRCTKYADGTSIAEITDQSLWDADTVGAYCKYNNDSANISPYGLLYNYKAVTVKDIAHLSQFGVRDTAWRVPATADWNRLITALGGSSYAGGPAKSTGTTYWDSPNTGATDDYDLDMRGAGARDLAPTGFTQLKQYAYFWASTYGDDYGAYETGMNATLSSGDAGFVVVERNIKLGCSLRLVKGGDEVVIGTQTWKLDNVSDNITDSKVYDNSEANRTIYGGLYQFGMIAAIEALYPGYHVPTLAEWQTLCAYLGGELVAGGTLKEAGLSHWANPNVGATNSSGFTALPGGYCVNSLYFYQKTQFGYFLTATEVNANDAYVVSLSYANAVFDTTPSVGVGKANTWVSVRLIKD